MKETLKRLIKKLPFAFTKNQNYDLQTRRLISMVCRENSNCIDVGCHKGEILDLMIKQAPGGTHFAFEPIPAMYEELKKKYRKANVRVFDCALGNSKGEASFNYVLSNPAYSGLIKRKYDRKNERDMAITVRVDRLDELIPPELKIDLIKIDVEGGELQVLEGGRSTISHSKPFVVFEHGTGASEFYGTTPAKVFSFFEECGMKVSLMESWLKKQKPLSLEEFTEEVMKGRNYYFLAYDPASVNKGRFYI